MIPVAYVCKAQSRLASILPVPTEASRSKESWSNRRFDFCHQQFLCSLYRCFCLCAFAPFLLFVLFVPAHFENVLIYFYTRKRGVTRLLQISIVYQWHICAALSCVCTFLLFVSFVTVHFAIVSSHCCALTASFLGSSKKNKSITCRNIPNLFF